MRWLHAPTVTHVRNRTKVYCTCGEQSKKYRNPEKALEWYARHTGLRERPLKVSQ